jgi:polysaccharide export outer membrane protein
MESGRRPAAALCTAWMAVAILVCAAPAQEKPQEKPKDKKEPAKEQPQEQKSNGAAPAPALPRALAEIRVGPGDVMRIDVYKEPEPSGDVIIRGDCRITLPLIKDVEVCGLTPTEISALLTEKLSKFIASPDVTVVMKQINSRKVYITGQVRRPGVLMLLTPMTLAQALTEAGGVSEYGNAKKVMVLRPKPNGETERFQFNYKDYLKGKQVPGNIELQPGDTIIVP